MTQRSSPYADWKAPGADSGVLVWPEPDVLLRQTTANHQLLANATAKIGGIELRELRRQQREWMKLDNSRPLIGMGHQTELYHPGVWAKLALMAAAGPKIGAQLLHLAVDTDAPKHLNLRWPGWSQPISDDPKLYAVPWTGLIRGPSAEHVQELQSALKSAAGEWGFKPMASSFLDDLQKNAVGQPALAATIIDAMHRRDAELGLSHQTMLMSPLISSEPYLALTHHLLARADEFAAVYNGALAQYRIKHRLRTAAKPMPDLRVSADEIESPFWLDDLKNGSRTRAVVERDAAGWSLNIEGDRFSLRKSADGWAAAKELQKYLNQHQVRLSPRALTLTLFTRLLVMDQFVHGIGGGRYDQVTDRVIEKFIGVAAPAFAVTTATLLFPTAVGRSRPCLPCLAHEGHRLRHGLLGEQKVQWVRKIADLPRGSNERQQAFSAMHKEILAAVQTNSRVKQWESQVAEANRVMAEELPLFDRELFYAIQPRERLESLIGSYQSRFAN